MGLLENGWQEKILLAPRRSPLNVPYFSIASSVYWEQVGRKRQVAKGEVKII